MRRVISFLKNMTKKDEPIIIFHNDADGVCSAALMARFLRRRLRKKIDVMTQPIPLQKNFVSKIKLSLPSKIIFVDLAVDQNPRLIKRLESFCEVLIVDHHPVNHDMNSKKTVHYNPLFTKKVYQSASYLVFKILSHFPEFNESKNAWIALVGAIGDYDLSNSGDLIRKAKRYYPDVISSLDDETVRNSVFGQIADMIAAGKAVKMPLEDVERIVEDARTYRDVLENEKLKEAYKTIQSELERIIIDANSKIDPGRKIFFYELKTKYSMRAMVATRLAEIWPEKIVLVWQKVRNKVRVACRNQKVIYDVGKLLRSALTPGMKASFGGHPAASGGVIDEKDWDEFRERLIRIVEKK